jgi:hypothetical protein
MKRSTDGFFLPENAQSTPPSHAGFSGVTAGQLHEEKTNYACLGGRATKPLNHSNPVTAVTDSNNLTLVMCSYSASSVLNLQQAPLPGKFKLIHARVSTELTFLEEPPS